MKYLIFIFAVVFASLAVLPCPDAPASQGNCVGELDGHEEDDQHQDESSEELCSPFCTCHCCHLPLVITGTIENASIPTLNERTGSLTPSLISKEFYSIWHPPKV